MPLPVEERDFLNAVNAPETAVVREAADKYLGLTGLSVTDLADAVRREYGRCGRSTLLIWLRGQYRDGAYDSLSVKDPRYVDARVWDYIQRHWPQRPKLDAPVEVLRTRAYHRITAAFTDARECGVNAVISGPPSSEKSEVLQYLVGARQAAGHDDAYYIKCDTTLATPLPFLRRVCRETGVLVSRTVATDDYLLALVDHFRRRPALPVLVFDEAQELPVRVLNTLRGLHDHTRRRAAGHHGVAFLLAGSHDLATQFEAPRTRYQLEQLSSRTPTKIVLTGMTREETLDLAARAFGRNGHRARLSEAQQKKLLEECTAVDPYTQVCAKCGKVRQPRQERCCGVREWKPLHYFSSRRLLEIIRQEKRAQLHRVATRPIEEVA